MKRDHRGRFAAGAATEPGIDLTGSAVSAAVANTHRRAAEVVANLGSGAGTAREQCVRQMMAAGFDHAHAVTRWNEAVAEAVAMNTALARGDQVGAARVTRRVREAVRAAGVAPSRHERTPTR